MRNQLFEITEDNEQLNFHIEGSDNKNPYSLDFRTIISLKEMFKFKLSEHINFISYVDEEDIVFGKNGLYDLNTDIKFNIMGYLPSSFLLTVSFKECDNLVGNLGLSFSIKK